MARAFGLRDLVPLLPVTLITVQQAVSAVSRWKAARLERQAAGWPAVDGRVRGGSVTRVPYAGFRLTLTYDAFASGHGIGLWRRSFPSKQEAEHARDVLTGQQCQVHYNPADEQEVALLWSEVQPLLTREPFVAMPVSLGRPAYRWLAGFAALAGAGLVASVAADAIAFAGSSLCVCYAIVFLFLVGLLLMAPSTGMMTKLLSGEQASGLARYRRVFAPWQMMLLVFSVVAAGVSLAHYGPIFRALPMEAEVPQHVIAGAVGSLLVPAYWFSFVVGMTALRRWKPVTSEAAVPAAV